MDDARRAYGAALDLFGSGKFDEAAKAMERVIAARPDFYEAYEGVAMAYSRLGDLERAIEWMQRLAELDPANPMAHTNLSVFYMKQGFKEKAEEEKAKATVLQFARAAKRPKD